MKSSGADWISEELTVAGDLLFNAYGGPDGGRLVSVPAGTIDHWAYRSDAIMPKGAKGQASPDEARYHYVLAGAPDGASAFLPADDDDLREAFLRASGEPGDRGTETLAAEIKRRGLDF